MFKKTAYLLTLLAASLQATIPDFAALANQYASQYPYENQLFAAAAAGDYERVYNLITYSRINPRMCNDFALVCAAHYGHKHIVQQLLSYGAYINTYEGAPLCEAARNGHLPVVETLLLQRANIHESYDYALSCAAWNGHTHIVRTLLDWGAYIHADNDAALRWACLNGHAHTVELLLRRGANTAANNHEALHNARYNGHKHIVDMLKGYDTYGSLYFWF